jgi:hypothetical protein
VGWLLALALLVVGLPAAAWLAQDHLIFLPKLAGPQAALPAAAQPLELATADGPRIRGWFLGPRAGGAAAAPTLIYFGGNAEDVSWAIADPRWPAHWAVVAFNYRGYGASEGTPGERALVADAVAIHDAIAARPDVDGSRLVAFGRSLGSGVAVALAAQRPLAGVVLASPYDSLVALGRHHYPVLPVSLLLRHRFDAAALAGGLRAPLLTVVASADAVIPVDRSRALYDAWAGPKRWLVVERTDHNTLSQPDAFWSGVARFLGPIGTR